MTTVRTAIETASAAMHAALASPVTGMFAGTNVVDGPHGACDLNAIHTGMSLLLQIADRTASFSGRRSGETPFRVTLDGHPMGSLRIRSVVEEDDRLKLYGIGLVVPDDMVSRAEPLASRAGRVFGIRLHTPDGALELRTAPGMRPGRRAR